MLDQALALLAVAAAAGIGCSRAPDLPARANIVLVMADDMGFSDTGPYGSEIPTPTLDAPHWPLHARDDDIAA